MPPDDNELEEDNICESRANLGEWLDDMRMLPFPVFTVISWWLIAEATGRLANFYFPLIFDSDISVGGDTH